MMNIRLLAFAPILMAGGCVLGRSNNPIDENTIAAGQVPVDQLAACIGAAVGTTPASEPTGGLRIEMPSANGANSFLVSRRQEVTTVESMLPLSEVTKAERKIAVDCAVKLAPLSNR